MFYPFHAERPVMEDSEELVSFAPVCCYPGFIRVNQAPVMLSIPVMKEKHRVGEAVCKCFETSG